MAKNNLQRNSTGCRPDTLINVGWIINPDWLEGSNSLVSDLLASGGDRLDTVFKESKQRNEEEEQSPGFEVDDHGLAHIHVTGPITKYPTSFSSLFGGTSTVLAKRAFRDAAADPRVKAFAVHYDTPGGTVGGVAELADTIKQVAEQKPVHGLVNGQCCSAGMWLASQCTTLSAEPTTEVGSVGGMCILTDTSENLGRQGVRRILIKSKGAEFKGIAAPGVKVSDGDIKEVESRLNDQVKYFLQAVQKGRGLSDEQMGEVCKARVYEAETAKKLGLIDKVAYTEDCVRELHDTLKEGGRMERSPAPPLTTPPAAVRNEPMPLTSVQVDRLKKLPGGETAAEASDLTQVLDSISTRLEALNQDHTKALEAAKSASPAAASPKPSEEAVGVKCERIALLVEKGHMTKAQGDALTKHVRSSPVGFFEDVALENNAKSKVIDCVMGVFALSKTQFSNGATTELQPDPVASKTQDDKPETKTEDELAKSGQAQGEAYKKEALRRKGVAA
jgi:signal peptide peptidase SppA